MQRSLFNYKEEAKERMTGEIDKSVELTWAHSGNIYAQFHHTSASRQEKVALAIALPAASARALVALEGDATVLVKAV
jgi:hypothetical protein